MSLRNICINQYNAAIIQWKNQSVLSTVGLTRNKLDALYYLTNFIRLQKPNELLSICRGNVVGLMFMEPSTRTLVSFSAAIQRLGGSAVNLIGSESSIVKGETLRDTARCLEQYCDIIVVRHPLQGSVAEMASVCKRPIINAGDGIGEHPTQALLDLYTILNEPCPKDKLGQGQLQISFIGDMHNGRTVHSLVRLLAAYDPMAFHIRYITPDQSLRMPSEIISELKTLGLTQSEHISMYDKDVLRNTDVLYVTRVQKERFIDMTTYERVKESFHINKASLSKFAKADSIIVMHPLPRNGEIDEDLDNDPRSVYFTQMRNGMYVRMALLTAILETKDLSIY